MAFRLAVYRLGRLETSEPVSTNQRRAQLTDATARLVRGDGEGGGAGRRL